MSSNPGQEGVMAHEEHATHEDAGISRFFFGHVPEGVHGGLKQYGLLAIFLGIITLAEFLIIVPENFRGTSAVIAPLVILSVIKFFCVVAFFMHLKFENRLLWQVFVAGLALGLVVALALVLLFGVFRIDAREFSDGRQAPFEHHPVEAHDPVARPLPEVVPGPVAPPTPRPTRDPDEPAPPASAALGKELFTGAGGCAACHTIAGETQGALGPELTNVAAVAGSRVAGQSAEDYLKESIVTPDAFTVEGFQAGLMQATMAGIQLTDDDVDSLVMYLLEQN
jgi:mono/diheme cytochrome c family protein/heme/copper-type cytochrome/quinol oxidase subunit 4